MLSQTEVAICGFTCACAVFGYAIKHMLRASMKHVAPGNKSLPALAPAELAYLLRGGDMTHTMLVLIIDLVQRAAKSGGNADAIELAPYERVIWTSVSDHVKRWAHQKADGVLPVSAMRDPLQWLARWRALRSFIGETLRDFVRETVKDPLHIRKYFSWSGILRFGVELYTSSARAAVEESLRHQLLDRDLIVPPGRRQRFAQLTGWLAPAMVAAAVLACMLLARNSVGALVVGGCMGFLNACLIKLATVAPTFIPTYDEFVRVSREVPRAGKRMQLVKAILRFIQTLLVVLMLAILASMFAGDLALLNFVVRSSVEFAAALLVSATVLMASALQCVLDCWYLLTHEDTTAEADRSIKATVRDLAEQSPLLSLKEMLTDSNYDQKFSDVMAVYGAETLWLLS